MKVGNYTSTDTIVCYGLDVKAWRDVRVDTIKEWYLGYPKGDNIMLDINSNPETH